MLGQQHVRSGRHGHARFRLVHVFTGMPGIWKHVAAGATHSCAIAGDGALWCWGNNDRGQLGDKTLERRRAPTLIDPGPWIDVQARNDHTCGIMMDGSVWCWGDNFFDGQIGDGLAWSRELRLVGP